jgi:MraZ protein
MDSLTISQTFYAGEFRHQLDEKHRLTIPARWRRGDTEDLIIVPEPNHKFLLVMSPDEFARLGATAESTPGLTPQDRRIFLRHFHSRAQHGSCDRQGRIVLPDDLCKLLALGGEVALVGGRGRFEIWNLKAWQRAQEEGMSTYKHVADLVGL